MADGNEVNGWVRRASSLAEILRKFDPSMILLAVAIAWASGWIPFKPLDQISADIRLHDAAMATTIRNRETAESKTVLILERMSVVLLHMEKRAQIIECAKLTDHDLRSRCLE